MVYKKSIVMKKAVYEWLLFLFTFFETLVCFGLLLRGVNETAEFFEVSNVHSIQIAVKSWAYIIFFISVIMTFYKTKRNDPFRYQALFLFNKINTNLYNGLSIPIMAIGAIENKELFLMVLIIFLVKKFFEYEVKRDALQEEISNEKNG